MMKIISFLGSLSSIIGIVAFFCNAPVITAICAGVTLIDSFLQVVFGDQNNFNTEIVTIIIGVIIGLVTDIGIVNGIAIALCFGCAIMTILGWGFVLFFQNR